MAFPPVDIVLWLILAAGVAALLHRFWRSQAIACARRWAARQALSAADWRGAVFRMDRQGPTLSFNAVDAQRRPVDARLRLRMPLHQGAWEVAEVAYCLPTGSFEDDTASRDA